MWILEYTCTIQNIQCAMTSDKFCQWLAAGWWFSPGTPVSSAK